MNNSIKINEVEKFVIGKWYCGFDKDGFGPGNDRDGQIGEYLGDGEFCDDEFLSFSFNDYDFFVEQN